MKKGKVVLVGTGFVGMSMAYSMLNKGGVNELILIDIDKELNKGNYNNSNIYTKETILKLINSISKNQYTDIEYIERF